RRLHAAPRAGRRLRALAEPGDLQPADPRDEPVPQSRHDGVTRSRGALAAAAFAGLSLVSGYRFYRLRNYLDFTDENDSIALGWLVKSGERLYRDVFSHHMPLRYMLCHAVALVAPEGRTAPYRILPWLLYVLVAGAIARSPLLTTEIQGVLAAGLFLGSASALLPLGGLLGHMVLSD